LYIIVTNVRAIMNYSKLLLRFWYWWYVVSPHCSTSDSSNGVLHPSVYTRWQKFKWSLRDWLHYKLPRCIPHSIFIWCFLRLPFYKYEIQILLNCDNPIFENAVELLEKELALDKQSYDGSFGDVCFCASKSQIRRAIVIVDRLAEQHPEWDLSQINELEDYEFMGVGY
jgi:hypothetical protein